MLIQNKKIEKFRETAVNFLFIPNLNRQRRGITVDYALPAIISSIGALVGKATVDSLGTSLGCCFYTLLAAQPSSGKSAAQSLSQEAVTMVESYFNVPDNDSIQVNAPTIEAFVRIMKKHPSVLGNIFPRSVLCVY